MTRTRTEPRSTRKPYRAPAAQPKGPRPGGVDADHENAYPSPIGRHDAAQLRREWAFRVRELADLPDSGMIW